MSARTKREAAAEEAAAAPLLDAASPAAKEVWAPIALEARRRGLGIEVRDGTPDLPYRVIGKERSQVDENVGAYATLDQAFTAARAWVNERPVPGPAALRDELRDHARRLAMLTPRDLGKKGGDFPLYRRFRDRVLPLAWDNLVDSTKLEALEKAVRDLLEVELGAVSQSDVDETGKLHLAVATLRGLVEPEKLEETKEATS